jgi:hypothetical protein
MNDPIVHDSATLCRLAFVLISKISPQALRFLQEGAEGTIWV